MVEPKIDSPNPVRTPLSSSARATEGSLLITLSDLPLQHRPKSAPLHFPFLSPPQRLDELGRLGNYRVLRLLGEGGMGYVFAAEDLALLRPVALKVMQPTIAAEQTARERFLREGQSAAAIRSDHVITIYQVGEANGVPFLAMELLNGQSLEAWLRAQTSPPAEAVLLKVAQDVLTGLVAAHGLGLIHRDIKPANLWVEMTPPRIKLLDFGLTHAVADPRLTNAGTIIGTPAYMSFEQANCLPLDGRADLYSLGAVLYRMAMGKPPFERENTMATLLALALDEPPPVQGLSPELLAFVRRLMARQPEQRPATAAQALQEVNALIARTAPAKLPLTQLLTTGQPALNVWVNLDGDADDEPTLVNQPVPPQPTLARGWLWAAGGAAALLGIVLLTVLTMFAWNNYLPQPKLAKGVEPEPTHAEPAPVVPVVRPEPVAPVAVVPPVPVAVAPPLPAAPAAPAIAPRTRWLEFKGQTHVEIPNLTLTNDGPLTMEAWVRRSMLYGSATVVVVRGTTRYVKLAASPATSEWSVESMSAAGKDIQIRNGPLTPPGEWVHLAVTWHGDAPTLFINGVPATGSASTIPRRVLRKDGSWLGASYFDSVDEVRNQLIGRYGGVRVSSSQRYIGAFQPPLQFTSDEQTVALYPCDDGVGAELRDVSKHKRHGRIINGSWTAGAPPTAPIVRKPFGGSKNLQEWTLRGNMDWQQAEGIISGSGEQSWIMANPIVKDFDFAGEVRLAPGSTGGIYLRVGPHTTNRQDVLKVPLMDESANVQVPNIERTGSICGVASPTPALNLAPNQWHTIRVRYVGSVIQVWVNGTPTTKVDVQDEAYRKLAVVQRGYRASGHIGLQANGSRVEYRNLSLARVE